MKLSYKDKVNIYDLRQNGQSVKPLSRQFGITEPVIKYMIRMIDWYRIDVVKKEKISIIHD